MNVVARLEFELTYNDSAVQRLGRYINIPYIIRSKCQQTQQNVFESLL